MTTSDIKFLWIDKHTIIVTESDYVKSWDFGSTDSSSTPAPRTGKRKSLRSRLSITSTQRSHTSQSPSPRIMSRFDYTHEIAHELSQHEITKSIHDKIHNTDRMQHLKYNGVDIESPKYGRMNDEEMTQYVMELSRAGSFQDYNLDKSSFEEDNRLRNGKMEKNSMENEFDLQIEMALKLSLEEGENHSS